MLKLGSIRWKGKCSRHPAYDPYLEGRGAIRGGCERCELLAQILERHTELLAMMKRFHPPPDRLRKIRDLNDSQGNLFGSSE